MGGGYWMLDIEAKNISNRSAEELPAPSLRHPASGIIFLKPDFLREMPKYKFSHAAKP